MTETAGFPRLMPLKYLFFSSYKFQPDRFFHIKVCPNLDNEKKYGL
jgi:hypothetical protein